jgi:exosortase/archaeosortase family protein
MQGTAVAAILTIYPKRAKSFLSRRKPVWLALCLMQGLLGISVVHATQDNASVTLLALIVWWGASLSVEDFLPTLLGKPSRLAASTGALLLLFCSWRFYATYHLDIIIYALFAVQAVGLALVGWPIKLFWKRAVQPVFILSLFGWQLLLQRALPMVPVTQATAKAVELLLSMFDYQVNVQGNTIYHKTGSLIVVDGCSGLELAIQLSVTAIIFAIVFPLKNRWLRLVSVVIAPAIAIAVNCIRVAMLTCVDASSMPGRKIIFELIHQQWGGLLFAGVAVALFGSIYLYWVEQQLIEAKVNLTSRDL